MTADNTNFADRFAQLFTPVEQFPRWFQPHPEIGMILVSSQEEEDELKARDWSPNPLPGSESPASKISSITDVQEAMQALQDERDLFNQQQVTARAEMDAKMARLDAMLAQSSGASSVPSTAAAPDSASLPSSDVPGGLSDASDDVAEDTPAAAPTSKSTKSK